MTGRLPDWCRIRRGGGPLVLVAPHGGRRATDDLCQPSGRRLKINDLHTAELAEELAERLDASLLANCALDRNELDLNRISAVARSAPWFLTELAGLVSSALEEHSLVEVVVIHGWHVVQPKCDVGVGTSLAGEGAGEAVASRLTVSPAYLRSRLGAFRARLEESGIEVAYGERFPASHPENLLQLFRAPGGARLGPTLAEAATLGRLQAVQLELGIPLRWPGPFRERFADTFTEVFGGAGTDSVPREAFAASDVPTTGALGVRVHDAASGLALVAGISPNGDGARGGRLLVMPGGNGVVLFTGEERRAVGLSVGALSFEEREGGFAVRFDGPAVAVDDGELYLRTEAALERARLVRVEARLEFRAGAARSFGSARGEVVLEGRRTEIDAPAFADASFARGVAPGERRRISLAAAFGRELGFTARIGDREPRVERLDAAGATIVGAALDEASPERIALRLEAGQTLVAEPAGKMSILRPTGPNEFARISFGVARFVLGDEHRGTGFYEYSEPYP